MHAADLRIVGHDQGCNVVIMLDVTGGDDRDQVDRAGDVIDLLDMILLFRPDAKFRQRIVIVPLDLHSDDEHHRCRRRLAIENGHLRLDDPFLAQPLQPPLHGGDRQSDSFGDRFSFQLAIALHDIENVPVKTIQLLHGPVRSLPQQTLRRIRGAEKIILLIICKRDGNCAKKPRYFIIILRRLNSAGPMHVGSALSCSSRRRSP
ncbi:hypothetical protein RHECNPAF_1360028 [Rhizobium etli CNPAF512]|nr:hypothetical protein RHECNPAF_1360028 [Rhizobium etli CNPAF512]